MVSGGEITGAEDTVSGKTIEIQLGGKISGGDFLGGTVINSGTIMNGTFNGSVTNNNGGEISGGNFTSAAMTNNGRITGGRFPHFEFMLDFDRTYLKITKNADCTDGVGELLGFELSELSSLGVSGVRVESGVSLTLTTEDAVTGSLTNRGKVTGGIFQGAVTNDGTISWAKLSGSAYYMGESGSQLTESEFTEDAYTSYNRGKITGCTFGEKTYVAGTSGTIEVTMSVNGTNTVFYYGDKILEKFGNPSGGWYTQGSDGEWTSVDEQATFGLPKRSFASGEYYLLSAFTAELNCQEETVTVTLLALDGGIAQEEIDLVVAMGDKAHTVENSFEQVGSYTMKLSGLGEKLGTALPASAGSEAAEVKISLALDGASGNSLTLNIPGGPDMC